MSHSWRKTKWTRPGVEPPPPRPPPQPPPPRPPPPRPTTNLKYVAPGVAKPADSSSVSRSGNLTYVAPGVEKPAAKPPDRGVRASVAGRNLTYVAPGVAKPERGGGGRGGGSRGRGAGRGAAPPPLARRNLSWACPALRVRLLRSGSSRGRAAAAAAVGGRVVCEVLLAVALLGQKAPRPPRRHPQRPRRAP